MTDSTGDRHALTENEAAELRRRAAHPGLSHTTGALILAALSEIESLRQQRAGAVELLREAREWVDQGAVEYDSRTARNLLVRIDSMVGQ